MKRFYIIDQWDKFEIKHQGYILMRITCTFSNGHRQDVQFEDLPTTVQNTVLTKLKEDQDD